MTSERVIDITSETMIDFVGIPNCVRRGQSADISYNLVHIAPLLRYIGETIKS